MVARGRSGYLILLEGKSSQGRDPRIRRIDCHHEPVPRPDELHRRGRRSRRGDADAVGRVHRRISLRRGVRQARRARRRRGLRAVHGILRDKERRRIRDIRRVGGQDVVQRVLRGGLRRRSGRDERPRTNDDDDLRTLRQLRIPPAREVRGGTVLRAPPRPVDAALRRTLRAADFNILPVSERRRGWRWDEVRLPPLHGRAEEGNGAGLAVLDGRFEAAGGLDVARGAARLEGQ
mmetsp:Transcript_56733/g.120467  ORF Transcript_56733/g.120467 Transcript_56733/m.120467 type:complete len:234 (-) Transcript_56733:280-981(-)